MHGRELPLGDLEGVDPLSREVFLAFRDAMLCHRQLMQKQFTEKGTHPGQAIVLGMLAGDEGLSQRDLAAKLRVSAPTVSAMLRKLEKGGLIVRNADEEDQRVTRIFLTEAGRKSLGGLQGVFAEIIKLGVGLMAEKDRRELARLLRQLADNVSSALAVQSPEAYDVSSDGLEDPK